MTTAPIRVLAVDDCSTAWEIYEAIFEEREDMKLVHRAETMNDVWTADFDNVDVVLMDGTVDRQDDGYEATERVMEEHPHVKVILSSYAPDHAKAIAAGAVTSWQKSYFGKRKLPEVIKEVVA